MDPETKCDICGKVDGEIKARYPERCNIEGLEPAFTSDMMEYGEWVRQQTLEEAIAVVVKYKEFAEIEKIENLGKDNVLLAYDMDSRWVASKHILSNLQALKDKNK